MVHKIGLYGLYRGMSVPDYSWFRRFPHLLKVKWQMRGFPCHDAGLVDFIQVIR